MKSRFPQPEQHREQRTTEGRSIDPWQTERSSVTLQQTEQGSAEPRLAFADESRIASVRYQDPDLTPLVSVVVPIFGAEYTLDEALASIEVQTMSDLEIVCVNDASTDASADIVEAHAQRDDRYVVLTHARNCGYGASMNDGIAAARGKWIAILEPDDYILPEMLERLLAAPVQVGAQRDAIDIIKSPYVRELRANGVRRGDTPKELLNCRYRGRVKPSAQPFDMSDAGAAHLLRHHPSIWSALYRRAFLAQHRIRFKEYPGSGWADNEFFYDTLLRASAIVYLDEPFYVYREETEEELAAFAQDRKLMRFERWQSMADIIDVLDIQAASVRAAHVSKGFSYLADAISLWGEGDPEVQEAAHAMFSRMDPALVEGQPRIAPHLKALYFAAMNIDHPGAMDVPRYYGALLGEFVHTFRSNGAAYTFSEIKKVLGR